MTYGHIWSTTSVSRLRNGIHQLTTDAEITEFNVSIGVQKNVRRFHICKQQHNTCTQCRQASARDKREDLQPDSLLDSIDLILSLASDTYFNRYKTWQAWILICFMMPHHTFRGRVIPKYIWQNMVCKTSCTHWRPHDPFRFLIRAHCGLKINTCTKI